MFYSNAWDPALIIGTYTYQRIHVIAASQSALFVAQMAVLQCSFYVVGGAWFALFHRLFGYV
jgi:hypothetical protein